MSFGQIVDEIASRVGRWKREKDGSEAEEELSRMATSTDLLRAYREGGVHGHFYGLWTVYLLGRRDARDADARARPEDGER